jgi:hypothetical protein
MNSLREEIRLAIMKGIDDDDRINPEGGVTMKDCLDPDTCGMCADEVIAVLMSALTGQHFKTKFHPSILGRAEFVSDGQIYT